MADVQDIPGYKEIVDYYLERDWRIESVDVVPGEVQAEFRPFRPEVMRLEVRVNLKRDG